MDKTDLKYYLFAIRIVGEFTLIIVIPVVILAMVGKYLDQLYLTQPKFLISGLVLAVLISGQMVYKQAKKFKDEYIKISLSK